MSMPFSTYFWVSILIFWLTESYDEDENEMGKSSNRSGLTVIQDWHSRNMSNLKKNGLVTSSGFVIKVNLKPKKNPNKCQAHLYFKFGRNIKYIHKVNNGAIWLIYLALQHFEMWKYSHFFYSSAVSLMMRNNLISFIIHKCSFFYLIFSGLFWGNFIIIW